MTSYKTFITRAAYEDIDSIAEYISKVLKNPYAANKFIDKIFDGIGRLSVFPKRNKALCIRGKDSEIRTLGIGNYLIAYRTDDTQKTVIVLRVIYSKRNIDYMLD